MTEAVAEVATTAVPAAVVANATPASETPAPVVETSTPAGETPDKPVVADDREKAEARQRRRINTAYRKAAEARAEADLLRRQIEELRSQSKPSPDPNEPKLEQFSDIEEFAKAKAEYAVKQAKTKEETERSAQQQRKFVQDLTASWEEKVEKFAAEAEDFDSVVGELKPVNALVVAIMDEDNGPQVAYHLAKNPDEARRIAGLNTLRQAKEIARLAAKLSAEPPKPKKPSSAPAPITPVQGAAAANTATEIKDGMDFKDFVKIRNRQLGRTR